MRQLYRFAELGQLSTVVMHELANHLTVLTLDIDDIGQRHKRSTAITHAKESIHYLDTMVEQVRHQLQESYQSEEFDILTTIQEAVSSLRSKALHAGVVIEVRNVAKDKTIIARGDPLRMSQIITIVTTNAIESYTTINKPPSNPEVEIAIATDRSTIFLEISDHGIGISDVTRSHLFEPFKTTKKNGMGIGLFVVKEMVETHFKGSIMLDPSNDQTTFIIKIPRSDMGAR